MGKAFASLEGVPYPYGGISVLWCQSCGMRLPHFDVTFPYAPDRHFLLCLFCAGAYWRDNEDRAEAPVRPEAPTEAERAEAKAKSKRGIGGQSASLFVTADIPDGTPLWQGTGCDYGWPPIIPDEGVSVYCCYQCRKLYKGRRCPVHDQEIACG